VTSRWLAISVAVARLPSELVLVSLP